MRSPAPPARRLCRRRSARAGCAGAGPAGPLVWSRRAAWSAAGAVAVAALRPAGAQRCRRPRVRSRGGGGMAQLGRRPGRAAGAGAVPGDAARSPPRSGTPPGTGCGCGWPAPGTRSPGPRSPTACCCARPADRAWSRSPATASTVRAGTRLHALSAAAGRARAGAGEPRRHRRADRGRRDLHRHPRHRARLRRARHPGAPALELVLADGSVRAGRRPDLLAAASVGLGAFGVITTVTLRCVPAFALRAESRPRRSWPDLLGRWDTLPAEADHVEFYWWPHTADCQLKRNTRVPLAELDPLPRWRAVLDDELVANALFGAVCRAGAPGAGAGPAGEPAGDPAARARGRTPTARTACSRTRAGCASTRRSGRCRGRCCRTCCGSWTRRSAGAAGGSRSRSRCGSRPADDRWLSTAYGRETAYLAAHRYVREPWADYFGARRRDRPRGRRRRRPAALGQAAPAGRRRPRAALPALRRRPVALRARLDPEGRFANAYTRPGARPRLVLRPPSRRSGRPCGTESDRIDEERAMTVETDVPRPVPRAPTAPPPSLPPPRRPCRRATRPCWP